MINKNKLWIFEFFCVKLLTNFEFLNFFASNYWQTLIIFCIKLLTNLESMTIDNMFTKWLSIAIAICLVDMLCQLLKVAINLF
jgi:hypothetical protein